MNTIDVPPAVQPRPQACKRLGRLDLLIALTLMLLAALYAGAAHAALDRRFFSAPAGNDVWFEADMPAVADTMLHRWANHARNTQHPLFPLMTTVPSYGLKAFGLTDAQRVVVMVSIAAAVWSATIFLLLRFMTPMRPDALVFALLAHVTAAAIFWLPTAETYVLGSATLLVPLAVVAWDDRRRLADGWYVAASALSLSATTSNWMAGIAAAASTRRLRAALQITVNALVVVIVLWSVQKSLVPSAEFFIGSAHHSRFLFPEAAGGPFAVARALMFHSVVMPDLQVVLEPKWGSVMSVQHAAIGSSGATGIAATILWTVLLAAGAFGLSKPKLDSRLRVALAVTVVGQVLLHLCLGEETFLYGLHVAPLLVVCAAAATTTSHRRWVTPLAGILIVLLTINNLSVFSNAAQFFTWAGRAPIGLP